MENVKSLLIKDPTTKALGNELEMLIISEPTQSNGFSNVHTVSCGGVGTLEMAWICKKTLTFWRVLVVFTSYVPGKLMRVWNCYRQFQNYLKWTENQIKEI